MAFFESSTSAPTLARGEPVALSRWKLREHPRVLRLLDVEPRIAAGLSGGALATACEQVVVPYVEAAPGMWRPGVTRQPLAVLVVEGKLLLSTGEGATGDLSLVGPGDVFDVEWLDGTAPTRVIEHAQLALLDGRFQLATRTWPQLVAGLAGAMFDSMLEQRRVTAALKMSRTEDRLLSYMSLLMARWGRVRPDGLVVTLPVTHGTLGRLVGARRPTVTLALSRLERDGVLRRVSRDHWWMPADTVAQGAPLLDDELTTSIVAKAG